MLEGARTETEEAVTFCYYRNHIRALFVVAKPVNNDGAPIREDCLDPKFASHGMDVISQSAEIHVRALLDTRYRTLRHI